MTVMHLRCLAAAIIATAAITACRSETDRMRGQFTDRLRQPAPLTPLELSHLIDESSRAMDGRQMRFVSRGVSHEPSEQERAALVTLLHGQISVEDGGVRDRNGAALRGVSGPATPVNSELEAIASVWVDVDTFLPRRYEFSYGQSGAGDYAYDITFPP
jgi:hypothetical protein